MSDLNRARFVTGTRTLAKSDDRIRNELATLRRLARGVIVEANRAASENGAVAVRAPQYASARGAIDRLAAWLQKNPESDGL